MRLSISWISLIPVGCALATGVAVPGVAGVAELRMLCTNVILSSI